MIEFEGWLLDLFEDRDDGLVLYAMARDGGRHRLTTAFPVTFYALGKNTALRSLWKYLRKAYPFVRLSRTSRMDVFVRDEAPVLAITVPKPSDLYRVFHEVENRYPSLDYADVDVSISLRFAAATGAYPLARCHFEVDEAGLLLHVRPLESPWKIDMEPLPFTSMYIAPNVNPHHKKPHYIRAVIHPRVYRLGLSDWSSTLITLRRVIHRFDPDLIITRWGDTWLLPLLMEKSEELDIDLGLNREVGRQPKILEARTYFSYGQIIHRGQQVHLFGRLHIDRRNAVSWGDYDLEGAIETCRVTALPLQTSARVSPGTGISSIEILTALRSGVLVPYQKQQAEILKPVDTLYSADQGGMVYQPLIGLHHNVAMIDFTSMYPAILVNKNISPETILPLGKGGSPVPNLGFAIDNRVEGLIPRALRPLLEKRIEIKRRLLILDKWADETEGYARRASSLKWLLVVCFGYLGYRNAKFGQIEAHQAITAYSREALLLSKEIAEDMGYEVIHMYVDGLWVRHPDRTTPEDIFPLIDEIERRTELPIALDGIYKWVVFVGSRNNKNRPVANRYFGVFQSGEIKVRGIDARRHDCASYVREAQLRIIKMLAKSDDPAETLPGAVDYLKRHIRALQRGEIDLESLIVRQRLSRELDAYRSPPPAARAAMQLAEAGKVISPGQKVAFIHTLGKPGVVAWDLPGQPDPRTVDVARYKSLLLRAAGIVLESWGLDEDQLRRLMVTNLRQLRLPHWQLKPINQHQTQ
ncbi:MAG: DNA polymerase domain-containing protein [Chloroflexota bacterium]|nr:DNA polymerase domain-containing protein [Chloroflexota bacterium]